LNVFALASVLGVFVLSDGFAHESGLLAVVVMGMVLGNSNSTYLKELLYFKESLSVLLISILFILLAANINFDDLLLIYNWKTAILFGTVVFLIRPIGVFLSTYNSSLKLNEKIFISWVGPRGIVAAGIASLFGLKLAKNGVAGAEYITPLVFMIVLGTVLLNATTARLFSKIVGVFLIKSEGILIVGASKLSRLIADYLTKNDRHVVLIDSNESNIQKAKKLGLEAITANIYSETLTDNIELNDVGYLMALTGNTDINSYVIDKFKKQFGENGSFRLISPDEKNDNENNPVEGLFSHSDDFAKLNDIVRQFPQIHEIMLNSNEHYQELIEFINQDKDIVPIFTKNKEGVLEIIPATNTGFIFEKNTKLVYLGKRINM
jgi:Trk K+ transport system NAD-binding subunit